MFLRNLQIYSIFLSLTVVLGCNGTGTLSVASDEFCPDYDVNSDVCQMQSFQSGTGEKDLLLEFMVPKETTLSTWKEWNHFIYFESPITVGYLLRWNRNASLDERTELRQDLHCSYSMRHPVSGVEVQGELEGKRLEKNGIWCFDYLGTLLAALQKEEGTLKKEPESDYFPVTLTMMLKSSKKHLRREVTRSIVVNWR
ncbi:MAG: hypothetical protein CMF59_19240 [Leptospiraceae bacterium]|nr:hypothetical protein [Leptospiraceae bacterium]